VTQWARTTATFRPSGNRRAEAPRALAPSAATHFLRPASVTLPGSRSRIRSVGDPRRIGAAPGSDLGVAHGCSASPASSSATVFRTPAAPAAPDPRVSEPGDACSNLQQHPGVAGLAHSGVSAATPAATNSSRVAVTAATARGGAPATPSAPGASGLTADPADNRPPSAGRAQPASQTYMPCSAVSAPSPAAAPRRTATATSLTTPTSITHRSATTIKESK
jgi:hypothetical protein